MKKPKLNLLYYCYDCDKLLTQAEYSNHPADHTFRKLTSREITEEDDI